MRLHVELLLSGREAKALMNLATNTGLAVLGGSDESSHAEVSALYKLSDAIQLAERERAFLLAARKRKPRPAPIPGAGEGTER